MRYKEEWAPLTHVENELEGILLREYLQKRGYTAIFYNPSPGRGLGGGKVFVLQEEAEEVRELFMIGAKRLRERGDGLKDSGSKTNSFEHGDSR